MKLLLTTAQISNIFLGTLTPDPLIFASCLHLIDLKITTHYSTNIKHFSRGFAPRPPSCVHSIDHEITTHYSTYINNFSGGFAHRPPYLSLLFTFNRLWNCYSLHCKYKKILGASPPGPLIYPSCVHSIDHEIATHYSANIKHFLMAWPPSSLSILSVYIW